MEKRQSDLLNNLVEQIAHTAIVRLSKRQLRHLHDAERLGKNTWRDLAERLPGELTAKDVYIVEEDDDVYLIRKSKAQDFANSV